MDSAKRFCIMFLCITLILCSLSNVFAEDDEDDRTFEEIYYDWMSNTDIDFEDPWKELSYYATWAIIKSVKTSLIASFQILAPSTVIS